MKLIGEKVVLTPMTIKHLPIAYKWVKDKEVSRFLEVNPPKKWSDEVKWFRNIQKSKNEKIFAITDKKSKKYIGNINLIGINKNHKKANLGIMIGDKNFWGKGYGTDTIKTLLNYSFKKFGLNKVILTVFSKNIRAQKCYLKCRFKIVGTLRENALKNGKFEDNLLMEVLAKDFFKKSS